MKTKAPLSICTAVLSILFLGLSFTLFWAADWFVDNYGRLGFDCVLFTLTAGLGGASSSLVSSYLLRGALPAVLWTAAAGFVFFRWCHRPRLLAVVLSIVLLGYAAWNIELDDYLLYGSRSSDLYERYYADPAETEITFPEEKRNLVYIMLESMETSYLSKEDGGAMEEDLIPELTALARENLNFSHSEGVGGYHCVKGTTWTIGSMVAQTAGIPLKTPTEDVNKYGENDSPFLPGVTSLMDVLAEAGYYQALMVGSDVRFGGRKSYYGQHGTDAIYDLYTARRDGVIPGDYFVWWGMEDLHLFEYAKQELTEIAQREEPFAFTMLTVDTHHIGGYRCALCEDSASGENYDSAISCSSRQVAAFIQWLREQPFYENTTVILVGDHESMDNGYFSRMAEPGYQRMVYNCFLNPAAEASDTASRTFTALDLFPTTLSALGCTIEGDRLGLGTDLFSQTPTLAEELGLLGFETQLAMASDYYSEQFYNEK